MCYWKSLNQIEICENDKQKFYLFEKAQKLQRRFFLCFSKKEDKEVSLFIPFQFFRKFIIVFLLVFVDDLYIKLFTIISTCFLSIFLSLYLRLWNSVFENLIFIINEIWIFAVIVSNVFWHDFNENTSVIAGESLALSVILLCSFMNGVNFVLLFSMLIIELYRRYKNKDKQSCSWCGILKPPRCEICKKNQNKPCFDDT